MSNEIKELTEEQKAKCPEYVERWTKIGLSTEPAEWGKATDAWRILYKELKYENFGSPVKVQSPVVGSVVASYAKNLMNYMDDEKPSFTRGDFFTHLNTFLRNEKKNKLYSLLKEKIKLNDVIINTIFDTILVTLEEVYKNKNVFSDLFGNGNTSEKAVFKFLSELNKKGFDWHAWDAGAMWASYGAWATFMRDELGIDIKDIGNAYVDQITSVGYVWPNSLFLIMCDRPEKINRNTEGQLHSSNDFSISWRDGWGLYHLNGVEIPEWIVRTPQAQLDPKMLETNEDLKSNVEVRREFIRKVGVERCLDVLKWKVLDKEGDYELGETVVNPQAETPRRYLKMLNPSIQVWHLEAVHPDCATVQDAKNYRRWGADWKSKSDADWNPSTLT